MLSTHHGRPCKSSVAVGHQVNNGSELKFTISESVLSHTHFNFHQICLFRFETPQQAAVHEECGRFLIGLQFSE
jgi:hypothetical protein